ncbi:MAG: isoprenylcysteine carboxylmethyltransferase family protein [Candidatus Peribacteraceae bacterium]|nr:isoprenylcysteine carboxylmethyltransferase family protein [Candidatus Peribacteraceae bacterium]
MMQLDRFRRLFETPLGAFDAVASIIVVLCVAAIFIAIICNFAEANTHAVRKERRSVVETGTMTLFFIIYYLVARFQIGALHPQSVPLHITLVSLSIAVLILGTFVNIRGRTSLGHNWANQIRMYDDQSIVHSGPYAFVRHPLYASLIWMFFAGSVMYVNWLLFLLTACVFVPFMTWRARQEEGMLEETFPEYGAYRKATGMFFPKLLRSHP